MASEGTQLEASPARKAQRGLKDLRDGHRFAGDSFLGGGTAGGLVMASASGLRLHTAHQVGSQVNSLKTGS